jgi:putative MATE family efflux protein
MRDFNQGPVGRLLLQVAGTFLISSLANTVFSLANIFWVGQLGSHAQAALTMAGNPIMVVLALAPVVSAGAGVLIAQAVGARDHARAERIFNEAVGLSLGAAMLVCTVLWLCRNAFGAALSADPETARMFAAYFRWVVCAMVLQVPLTVMAGTLGAIGDLRASVWQQTASIALRLAATPVLMFGWLGFPRLGVEGAGIAGLASAVFSAISLCLYFARDRSFLHLRPARWLAWPRTLWPVLRIGLPVSIETAVGGLYLLLITVLLRPYGPVAQAGFGIGQRLFMTGMLPITLLTGAGSMLIAHAYGARLGARIQVCFRTGLGYAFVFALLLFVAFERGAGPLCGLFSKDPVTLSYAVDFLHIGAFGLFPVIVVFGCYGLLSGMGNTLAGLIVTSSHALLVAVLSLWLAHSGAMTPDRLWILLLATGVVQMVMALAFARSEFRKRFPAVEPDVAMTLQQTPAPGDSQ